MIDRYQLSVVGDSDDIVVGGGVGVDVDVCARLCYQARNQTTAAAAWQQPSIRSSQQPGHLYRWKRTFARQCYVDMKLGQRSSGTGSFKTLNYPTQNPPIPT